MNDPCKIIDINEIHTRKKEIINIMIKELQERNEQKILKRRAVIEMKFLKPQLLLMNQKKNDTKEQFIQPILISKEFEDFMLQMEEFRNKKHD